MANDDLNKPVNEGEVVEKLDSIDQNKKDDILSNFQQFKEYLGSKVEKGEKLGMNEEQLAKAAKKVADYLAVHEEPRNREEKVLQEIWKVGNDEQRHQLAHMLVKLVQTENS